MFPSRLQGLARAASRASQCVRPRIGFLVLTAVPSAAPTSKFSIASRLQQQRRQASGAFWPQYKKLVRENPISAPFASFIILFFLIGGPPALYMYYNNFIIGAFQIYPEPVAKQMRKALFYSNISLDAKLAVKYYREALRAANEIGMDPFSDEIMGIKIQLAAFFEKLQGYEQACQVLEIVKRDNLKWVEVLGGKKGNEGKRTRVLTKTVEVSVKLGELYANEFVKEDEKAEESLVWAVETILKEQQRREKEGVKEGEGEWMTPEKVGGSMESLAHHYEEKNMHHFAAPLFLQAISLSPSNSCHTAVLMNNLSISLAQQNPPPTPGQAPASRPQLVSNARLWAEKAIAIAAKIAPPERTSECDEGCAVATHNLGEFAEMDGNLREARKRYEEAKSLAKAIGFQAGVMTSEDGLRRLEGKA